MRAEEHQENHVLRAEEVPPPLQETEALRQDPGGRSTEWSIIFPISTLNVFIMGSLVSHHTDKGDY